MLCSTAMHSACATMSVTCMLKDLPVHLSSTASVAADRLSVQTAGRQWSSQSISQSIN